ncbi:MAG: EAL domain-containing protein, partial [Gammaproteobacteria bacterium]|nr:EAL domain-containing protein [Gammaproteobacteria bacterium]
YRIRLATNGEMALSSVTSNIPDLILLDITMPGMNGFEVCEKIKNNPRSKAIPIIFLSALKEEFDIVRGFAMGAIDFVTKPFNAEVLLARVDTHLTINQLQSSLTLVNENLETIVETRTGEIKDMNTSLKCEVERHIETQGKLSASEKLHRLTLANIDDTVVLIENRRNEFTYISPSIEKIFGYRPDEFDKNIFAELFDIALFDKSIPKINGDLQSFEMEIRHKNGTQRTLIVSVKNAFIHEDVTTYICRDITHLVKAQNNLAQSELRLRYALSASNEGIWDWDVEHNKTYYNDAYFNMLGYCDNKWPHEPDTLYKLLHPDDVDSYKEQVDLCIQKQISEFRVECRLKKSDGNYCWITSKGKVVERDSKSNPVRIVGTHTNISSEKAHLENLAQLASYDELTGLPNRKYFRDIVNGAISRAKRNNQQHAILFLDLDRFKNINDSMGHSAGDLLLKLVATRLTEIVRGNDTVARLGGDEFTVLLDNITGTHKAAEISTRIIEALSKPFELHGHKVIVSPSIGIVIFPDHGVSHEELLKKADTAMYQSKKAGGNAFWFFTDKMNADVQKRLKLEEALHQALKNDEFSLHYQPRFDAYTHTVAGMEALARWNRNGHGFISPVEFIPTAEETGLILTLGDLIISKAIQQIKRWTDSNLFRGRVAINISARQFKQPKFLENFQFMLEEANLSPEYLEIEITEAAVMENISDAIVTMNKIKDFGITLAMDDFGTGFSSLSYLSKFPIDVLKIDRSFINNMLLTETNLNIVKTIIDLAHILKLKVVAEGVEQEHQLHSLQEMGCDFIQGFLYSKPLEVNKLENLLKTHSNLH